MDIVELDNYRKKRAGKPKANPPFYFDLSDLEVPDDLVSGLYESLHPFDFTVKSPSVAGKKKEDPSFIKDFPIFTCDYDDYFPKP